MLRRIFVPKRDYVTGGWRKLYNEELHNLYSAPSIIRMIKYMRIRSGHVARLGRRGMHVIFLWERQKKRNQGECLDVGGRIILKWILD
jgi:hypothetical protein